MKPFIFVNSTELIRDFKNLNKGTFLDTYKYITEKDYEATKKELKYINQDYKNLEEYYNRKEWKDYDNPLTAFLIYYRFDETKEYGCNCDDSCRFWYDPDMNEYYEVNTQGNNLIPNWNEETYLDEMSKRRCVHCDEIITDLAGK